MAEDQRSVGRRADRVAVAFGLAGEGQNSPASRNCTAMAHRIRPRTRTTMVRPILPRMRVRIGVARKHSRTLTPIAAMTPRPTAAPMKP